MKIVLTGASSGIGRHLALTLATEHEIWGIARNESVLQAVKREAGAMFCGTSGDVSSWSSLQSIVESVSPPAFLTIRPWINMWHSVMRHSLLNVY